MKMSIAYAGTSKLKPIILLIVALLLFSCKHNEILPPPNILWIVSEDNSPFLGCYGDTFATTPNLDKLAESGFLYTHAYANAPVCAPARNTIITGVYANSNGHQHMRSKYNKSETVRFFPEYLRKAGYYCTNNKKEDYNINEEQTKGIWNESSTEAHYENRASDQPFFAIFNIGTSHESSIHKSIPENELRHRPEDVTLPPYHPDTPEMRHDWAQYYDIIENMDAEVGAILKELEEKGESENTIVFYYGDHGGVLGRSKRFVYESGTQVPFIVHIPKKFKHLYPNEKVGSKVDRLISFVDLAPTLLSLLEIEIPNFMQGNAFLGGQKNESPDYAFMFRGRMDERYDMSRAVRGKKYRYIRNYMPYRIYGQPLEYLWKAPSMPSWEAAYKAGNCNETQSAFWQVKPQEELYDTEKDPWEVHNLANNDAYRQVLDRMRSANHEWMLKIADTGILPEEELIERIGELAAYDYMRSGKVELEPIINAADLASTATKNDLPELISLLKSKEAAIRYWGITGLLILGNQAAPAIEEIKQSVNDSSLSVAVTAAEALYRLGQEEEAIPVLIRAIKGVSNSNHLRALNIIDNLGVSDSGVQQVVRQLIKDTDKNGKDYNLRIALYIVNKWDNKL